MYTVVNDNSAYNRTVSIYTRNNKKLDNSVLKLASGLRINSAADDASGLAMSENLRTRIRALNQANSNVQTDSSLAKTAEGAIGNTIEILQTLKARAIQAADGTYTDDEREVIQTEVAQYLDQIDKNAQIKFGKQSLIDGSKADTGLTFHIGDEANFSITVKLNAMDTKGLGLADANGNKLINLSTQQGAIEAMGVKNADGSYSPSGSKTDGNGNILYGKIDEALNRALKEQAKIGSIEARLGYTSDNLTASVENLTAADSTIRDADMAKEMSNYVKWNVLTQAAQMMFAQQNQNAGSVINLLQPVA